MRRGGIGGVLLILIYACCAWGYTALELGIGSEVFQGSARCVGMGEVSLLSENSPRAAALNPALLTRFDRRALSASYRLVAAEEDWSLPVHDSFDALLGYETYSHNRNTYHDGDLALTTGRISALGGVSFGLAYLPAYDFDYNFYEEVRDRNTTSVPADKVIARGFVESEGAIRSLSFGLGKSLMDKISVGIGIDYLWGDYDIDTRLTEIDTLKVNCWEQAVPETSDAFHASDLGGTRFNVGLAYRLNNRIEMAAVFKSQAKLDGDYTSGAGGGLMWFLPREGDPEGGLTMKYPASYSFGVTFRPRNELAAVIEGNVRYVKWADAGNGALSGIALRDIYEWSIGVEHVFYNGQPVRFGFTFRPSPLDVETSEAAVTIGSGMTMAGLDIDFAVRMGWREYREFSLFDDTTFCAKERGLSDKVEDTLIGATISVTRAF
jgi:long-subunit fatty acid transport protein